MGDGDLRTTLVAGARVLGGWACVGVAALDLLMGTAPGPYLLFHLVLLCGGLLFLMEKPFPYAVSTALALLSTVVAALPATTQACCLRALDVRHGYPLTVLAWNPGQVARFAAAHTVADVLFWFLTWSIVWFVADAVRTVLRRRPSPVGESVGGLP